MCYVMNIEIHHSFIHSYLNVATRHAVFLGFSSFAQNQNFPQKFWAETQNFKIYEFPVFR